MLSVTMQWKRNKDELKNMSGMAIIVGVLSRNYDAILSEIMLVTNDEVDNILGRKQAFKKYAKGGQIHYHIKIWKSL